MYGTNGYTVDGGLNLQITGSHTVSGILTVVNSSNLQFAFSADSPTTLSNPINNNATVTFGNNGGNGIVYTGAMSGTGAVSVQEPVTFAGNNTYSGQTTITSTGTLSDSGPYAYSASSDMYLGMGATLNVNYDEAIGNLNDASCGSTINLGLLANLTLNLTGSDTYNGNMTGGGSLTVDGTSGTSLTLLNSNNYSGGTTIGCGVTLQLGNGDSTGSITGPVVDNGTLAFDNPDCFTFSGSISGHGGVSVEDGMVTLSGANTYCGTTTVTSATLEDGTLGAFSPNSLMSLSDEAELIVNYNETIKGLTGDSSSAIELNEDARLLTTGSAWHHGYYTFAGSITGSGSVEIGSNGREIFIGNNTYSEGTTIDAHGVLQLGDGESTGSITDTVYDSGKLVFDNPDCFTFCGTITGSGGVTIEDGMVTLMGDGNDYTGRTRVEDGAELTDGNSYAFSSSSAIKLSDGASLVVNYSEAINGLYGDSSTTVSLGEETNLLTYGSTEYPGHYFTYAGSISGYGSLEIGDYGYQVLTGSNSYTGGTTIDCMATLQLGDGTNTGSITGCVFDNGALIFDNPNCYTFCGSISGNGSVTVQSGMVTLMASNTYQGGTTIDSGAKLQLGNGDSTGSIEGYVFDNGKLAFDNPDCYTFCGSISGTGGVTVEGDMVTLMGSGNNTYFGTTLVKSELEDGSCDAFSPNSAVALACDASLVVNYNEAINGLCGSSTSTVSIADGYNLLTNGSNGGSGYAYAGSISGGGSLEIGSGGYQILTGSNSYTGGTTIDSTATLQLGDGSNTGSITGGVTDNGTFVFNNPSCYTFCGSISGAGTVTVQGGMLTLMGSNSYSGGTTLNDGVALYVTNSSAVGTGAVNASAVSTAPTLAPSGGNVSLSNNIVVNSAGLVLNYIGSSNTLTLSGVISDLSPESLGSLVVDANVVLSGANTFSGGTTLNSGNLFVTNSASLGTGSLIVNDADMPGLAPLNADVTLPNAIELPATGLALNVSGSPYTLTLTGNISNNGSDAGALVINGPVTLSGNNTYTGGTTITDVTTANGVTIASDTGLGSGPVTAMGSILTFTSASPVVYGLSLSETTVNFTGATPMIEDMVSDSADSGNLINIGSTTELAIKDTGTNETDFYGTIAGGGSLEKKGSGTLDLYGDNTYSGGTTVEGGLLVANSNSALGTGTVTVNGPTAVLGVNTGVTIVNPVTFTEGGIGGYGTVAPSVPTTINLSSGSTVAGGRGTFGSGDGTPPDQGAMTFGANTTVIFGPGGVYDFAIQNPSGTNAGTDYSTLNLNGAFSITATSASPFVINVLSVNSSGTIGNNASFDPTQSYQWTLLTTGTPITGFASNEFSFSTAQFNSGAFSSANFFVTEGAGDTSLVLNFTPVPEPSTWALMASGVFALGAVVRRRRR